MAANDHDASCFKFVVRGNYEDTLRYLEKERQKQRADVRFAFDTRKNSIDQNCQTPDHFFHDVLQLHHATGTIRRKKALIEENRNRYSKDSGFSDWNSLERNSNHKVSMDRTPISQIQFKPKIDTSDLILDQNIIDLIDLGRFSHLTNSDPLEHVLENQKAHFSSQSSLNTQNTETSTVSRKSSTQLYPMNHSDSMQSDYSELFPEEVDYFDKNALDIERISPSEATVQLSKKVRNKHLQEVIRTKVKNRVSTQSTLSDLFEDIDDLCDGIAERIQEKLILKTEGPSMPGSPFSGASRRKMSAFDSPILPRRTSEFTWRDINGPPPPPNESRKTSINLDFDMNRNNSMNVEVPRYKNTETQYSPDLKRKKRGKTKKLFRSNSAGDILEEEPRLAELQKKENKKGSMKRKTSLFDEFKRRVSIKPSDKVEIEPPRPITPTPPPPPPEIEYNQETTKDIQTPQYLHKQHAKVMSEIKDAMEVAQMDIPAMFIYDVDLQNEVWVSQPGDNRIFQLEKHCTVCKEGFKKSAFIVCSGGLFWHSNCFVCVQCFQPFKDPNDPSQESVFYEHEDRPYCHNCYTVNFAPMCFTCGGWVIGRVIEALDVKWHPECFGCYMCGAELCENGFFKHNGRPICIDCHDLLKKKKKYICNKCFTPIEEFVLWYLKESYHPYHFSCQNCYKPLDNKYKEKDNQFYCQLCFDTVIQDVCAACKKAIDGRAIKAASKAWCPEHFLCYQCERPLSGDKFMLNEGKPYCQYHYMKMFGVRCFYCDNRSSMQVIKVLNKNYCEKHFFCTGCDTLLEEKKSKVIEMDMKPYCRHCYDKFPSDMRRKLLDSANMTAKNKKATMKKDKKGSMKKPKKEKKADNREIVNATETAS